MFDSKAQTLSQLANKIKSATILPLLTITHEEFQNNKVASLKRVQKEFTNTVIVRSSAKDEDRLQGSGAGHYTSIPHIDPHNENALQDALEQVFLSYEQASDEEVLIQPQLNKVKRSGVILTADLETKAPYFLINESVSSDTSTITAGKQDKSELHTIARSCPEQLIPEDLKPLIALARELQEITHNKELDIEYAQTQDNTLYLLQVRPIAQSQEPSKTESNLDSLLEKTQKKIEKRSRRHPDLLGNKAFFGVMPDWNPAEIIGVRPKMLATSLYQELVTDRIWAYQRHKYGYRDLRSHPLMTTFLGRPFVDVRVSFNSFIPSLLNKELAEKLVNHYLEELQKNPNHHDKVEFEIVLSCLDFNLNNKLQVLNDKGFLESETNNIKAALANITKNILAKEGPYQEDQARLKVLDERYHLIHDSELSTLDKIYWLIEDAKRYGTLPFAGIARAGFIGMQLLNSMVDQNLLSPKERSLFLTGLNTITQKISLDLHKVLSKQGNKDDFLKQYGHLRPGTYDITSERYDEAFDRYFSNACPNAASASPAFELLDSQKQKINKALESLQLDISAEALFVFISEALAKREWAKFLFSRSISDVLVQITKLGDRFEISKEDLAHIDYHQFKELYANLDSRTVAERLKENIAANKQVYESHRFIRLPQLITNPEQVYCFKNQSNQPNFITQNHIEADTLFLEQSAEQSPSQKIVFISSADPGYDFLFSHNIAGLVTEFGGANSHMAIRCAELNIPAVIGAGPELFKQWQACKRIKLDCLSQKVEPIL
ncbi:MAG: hypothetical protein H7A33_07325 [Deltaproteobacteria bacterium]|nr:hypothetical protein [Deltaproteobacteria bacterium]